MIIDMLIEAGDWSGLEAPQALIERAARAVSAETRAASSRQACVVLSNDATVAGLNGKWRGKPHATNVLSFPAAPAKDQISSHIGDIILADGVVAHEAARDGKTLNAHVSHLVIHGLLHLLKYHHDDDAAAERMEAVERAAMQRLGLPDPYASSPVS